MEFVEIVGVAGKSQKAKLNGRLSETILKKQQARQKGNVC